MGSHRVRHNWSDLACMHALEKAMATPSSILAWRIPGMEGPGGLSSTGLHRVRHDWSDLAAAAADGKEPNCNEGDLGSIPGLRRSPGEGHGNPLQYSCLDNPHGQRGLVGYSPWGHRVRHDWATKHSAAIEPSTASSGGPTVTPAHSVWPAAVSCRANRANLPDHDAFALAYKI